MLLVKQDPDITKSSIRCMIYTVVQHVDHLSFTLQLGGAYLY